MPWWGWVLVAIAIAVIVPLKLRVWKMLMSKADKEPPDDDF